MAFKICIDPGHGANGNPYPNRAGFYEGTQMFKLAQLQKAALEQYEGVTVILSRKKVTDDPSLDARGKMAAGCDLFYSEHSNASDSSGTFTSARGVSVIDSNKKPNKALADKMGETVAAVMGNYFRGTSYRDYMSGNSFKTAQPALLDYYGVIRSAVATTCKSAIIVEHGFHTNEADSAFLIDDENLRKLAEAEAAAIAAHYGLKKKAEPKPTPAPAPVNTYIVQKGDSLSKIGAKLGIPWQDIAAVNGITAPYTIYVGQVLNLSGGGAQYREYVVRDGDNPYKIAREQLGDGARYTEIEDMNGLPHGMKYAIHTGDVLRIPVQ